MEIWGLRLFRLWAVTGIPACLVLVVMGVAKLTDAESATNELVKLEPDAAKYERALSDCMGNSRDVFKEAVCIGGFELSSADGTKDSTPTNEYYALLRKERRAFEDARELFLLAYAALLPPALLTVASSILCLLGSFIWIGHPRFRVLPREGKLLRSVKVYFRGLAVSTGLLVIMLYMIR